MLNVHEFINKLRPFSIRNLEDIGDILQYLLPWGALLIVALQGNRPSAWIWIYSGASTVILTTVGKFVFNFTPWGTRPNGDQNSFPSGHTSSAFMGAAFIHFQIGFGEAFVPYLLAALTGYSRVQAKKHWPRDIFSGAFLAILLAYIFAL